MPELPEVESVVRSLSSKIIGRRISNIYINNPNLRNFIDINIGNKLVGSYISEIYRRAKYIVFIMDDFVLIIHLGMTGILLFNGNLSLKHNHVNIFFDDGNYIVYNDCRRFGSFHIINKDEEEVFFSKIGMEPLIESFNYTYLKNLLKGNRCIKSFLMDNKYIAGIGNIYASEILYMCGISPLRQVKDINDVEINNLIYSIKNILTESIKNNGSSIRDYKNADGVFGVYQKFFKVYNRQGKECYNCQNKIEKILVNGRSTFLCNYCQS
ncbi:MAG: formamidopyrimidine-DNA glycosylase [Candidatus Xenolissoclinum pacificiensis L6]|uniref:Formamidopyrimidine-DNA glycosylase n=1 Tax=Candidatus Xenolissoclinum pacificiensis L6 TaxID=1401685 RepID=W2V0M5_9RICK|nr:MAG: formamidopyrimidine-DNA glycosylase [Candidatus Xenolissoclinum pacificiensis L6]